MSVQVSRYTAFVSRRRWLSDAEQLAWRRYQAMSKMLESTLDRQLQRDANMPHGYYTILARLSAAPGRSARITALAEATETSQSRVSHAISALDKRGWVRREKCTDDTRGTLAVLTPEGQRALEEAAPDHVALVRATVFDALSAEQVEQLGTLCRQILEGLDPDWTDPVTQP